MSVDVVWQTGGKPQRHDLKIWKGAVSMRCDGKLMIEVSLKFERGGRSDVFQSISIMFLVAGGVKVAPIPKGKSGS